MKKVWIAMVLLAICVACNSNTQNNDDLEIFNIQETSSQQSLFTETPKILSTENIIPSQISKPYTPLKWIFGVNDFPDFNGFDYWKFRDDNYHITEYWFDLTYLTSEFNEKNDFRIFYPRLYYYDDHSVYTQSRNNQVVSIDINTGNVSWTSDIQGYVLGLGSEAVIVKSENNRIYGLDKRTGKELWKVIIGLLLPENQMSEPFPYIQNYQGEIIVPMKSECGKVKNLRFLHIDESTGGNWITGCNTAATARNVFAFINGLFIADYDNLVAYNPNDGSVVWEHEISSFSPPFMEFNPETNIVYIETNNNPYQSRGISDVIAIDLDTGSKLWGNGLFELNELQNYQYYKSIKNFFFTKMNIYYYNENEILIFNKDTGVLINRISLNRSFIPFFTENGLLVFYPNLGICHGVDLATGEIIWENDEFPKPYVDNMFFDTYYLYFSDLVILLDSQTEELFSIDQKTGEEIWRKTLPDHFPYDSKDIAITSEEVRFLYKYLYEEVTLCSLNPLTGEAQIIFDPPMEHTGELENIQPINDKYWILGYRNSLSLIELP